ncbi:hypothetical protein B0O99DRAFT_686048 [Bisporella sp. PMI_857]|nr:hypothetical protein B0O99DRAFT_686048 [Bisporella sp. PMI_857]
MKGPGKFLEMKYINIASDEGSEWHELRLKHGQDIGVLKNNLCRVLDLFQYWNSWEDIPGANANTTVHESQELVDVTWNCHDDRTVANLWS